MAIFGENYNEEFAEKIVLCKGDTTSKDWQEVRENVEKSGTLKKPVEKLLPKNVIEGFFVKQSLEDVYQVFEGLEQAFLSLHIYAANLCNDKIKVDYSLLKVYNVYVFASTISCEYPIM